MSVHTGLDNPVPQGMAHDRPGGKFHRQMDNHWRPYWEGLKERQLFRAEAADYVGRLEAAVRLDANARVLDFGCGFGFVAEILAPRVGELLCWDLSFNMRLRARLRLAGHRNVRVLDSADLEALPNGARVDVILVNSVVQYMTHEEFCERLKRWREMLAPDGLLIISDLITHDAHPLHELVEMLAFSARRGLFVRALSETLDEFARYVATRRSRRLYKIKPGDLHRLASGAGLAVEFLPRNLTYRRGRSTVVLSTTTPGNPARPLPPRGDDAKGEGSGVCRSPG